MASISSAIVNAAIDPRWAFAHGPVSRLLVTLTADRENAMDRIEQVARAICAADGRDPDEQMRTDPIGEAGPERPPQWHRYRDEARRIVAAFEALAGPITSDG